MAEVTATMELSKEAPMVKVREQVKMTESLESDIASIESAVTTCKALKINIENKKIAMVADQGSFTADDVAEADKLIIYFQEQLNTIFKV